MVLRLLGLAVILQFRFMVKVSIGWLPYHKICNAFGKSNIDAYSEWQRCTFIFDTPEIILHDFCDVV